MGEQTSNGEASNQPSDQQPSDQQPANQPADQQLPDQPADPQPDQPENDESPVRDWAAVAADVERAVRLAGESFKPAGSGTQDDPWVIATPEAFAWWANLHAGEPDTFARLDADIDLMAYPWTAPASLAGELDGAGHAIEFATEDAGLFGTVEKTGAVHWLTLGRENSQAAVETTGALAGSVCAANKGAIEGVVNLVPVSFSAEAPAGAERFAGGIVAVNDGTVKDCANLGAVENDATAGDSAAGGIAAKGAGTIATSYNAGDVRAAQNAAYVVTLLDAEGDYASVVDDVTCYLAPGEAVYEGVAAVGQDRPGALASAELADAADRLNDGREGDAAVWAKPDAADGPTAAYPAPVKPANPDAAPALLSLAAPRATTTYASWFDVGKAVYEGTLDSMNIDYYPSGMGTASDPYVIKTPEALAVFTYAASENISPLASAAGSALAPEAHVVIDPSLTTLDLFGSAYTGATKQTDANGLVTNVDDALPWWPICLPEDTTGYMQAAFTGSFNGNGCVLSAMRIVADFAGADSWAVAFIVAANGGAVIENVHVGADSKVVTPGGAGGIVGSLYGNTSSDKDTTLRNCSNAGSIQATETKEAGGLVYRASRMIPESPLVISGCSNSGAVSAPTSSAGGIAGLASDVNFSGCSNSGAIEANAAGGIGGKGGKMHFSDCFNEGSVKAVMFAGGIAGFSAIELRMCGNVGPIAVAGDSRGNGRSGGLVGAGTGSEADPFVVESCYNTGTVSNDSADAAAAGLVGMTSSSSTPSDAAICTISNSYNVGAVTSVASTYALAGPQRNSTDPAQGIQIANSYYANDAAGADATAYLDKNVPNVTAKPSIDMKTDDFALTLNGGTYVGDSVGTTSTAWTTDARKNGADNLQNDGFPVFGLFQNHSSWETVGAAVEAGTIDSKPVEQNVTFSDKTTGSAYVITTPAQLAWFAYRVKTATDDFILKNVQLAADLDLSGFEYSGLTEVGANYANCLEWLPIGWGDVYDISTANPYGGHFDGAGHVISNLRLVGKAGVITGLFGNTLGSCTIERVGLVSGCLAGTAEPVRTLATLAGGLFTGTMKNCFSRVDVASGVTLSGGALVSTVDAAATVEGCYYAGSIQSQDTYPLFKGAESRANAGLFYDSDKLGTGIASIGLGIPTDAFKTWAMAAKLNVASPGAWRTDTANANEGYPVPCKSGESLAAGTWQNVGEFVDKGGSDKPQGAGVEGDPYLVGTPEQLAWFAYKVNADNAAFKGIHVKLTADIGLAGYPYTGQTAVGGNYANCLRWAPVGTFAGVFDGDGHTVRDVRIQDGNGRGFFVNLNGQVKNLILGGGYIYGKEVAALAHNVSGASASVVNCVTKISVESYTKIYPNRSHMGGITYRLQDGARIDRSGNEGSLTLATVATASNTVGRVGGIASEVKGASTISNCYNIGALQANSACLGGIAGSMENTSTIENCFNAGSLTNRNSIVTFGDIVASGNGIVKNCYASTTRTAESNNADGSIKLKHLTAVQMQTRGFALNLNGNKSGTGAVWTWNSGDTYPTFGEMPAVNWLDIGEFVEGNQGTFGSFKPTVGDGTSQATAVEIATPEALAWYGYRLRQNATPGSVKLTADIDLTGGYVAGGKTLWVPMCAKDAGGGNVDARIDFEGGGHTVGKMTVEAVTARDNYFAGLFGSASGSLSGVVLVDSSVTGASGINYVGGLVGQWWRGTISRCGVANGVSVTGKDGQRDCGTGGLVGWMNEGVIENCWSRAAVTGMGDYVGGLLGRSGDSTQVKSCYSVPTTLSGGTSRGDIAGDATGTFERCYWLSGSAADGGITGGTNGAKAELEMRAPNMAFLLNNGSMGADAAWTWDPFKNDRYPILGVPPIDAEINDWDDVGALQNEDTLRRTEVSVGADGIGTAVGVRQAQPVDGNYLPALSGSGTDADPYVVATPEALAWWGHQVNYNNDGHTHNASGAEMTATFYDSSVRIGAAIDLAGLSYTGAAEIGANHANCLEWTPITSDDGGSNYVLFSGSFDGGGYPIENVRLIGREGSCTGFFGSLLYWVTISRVMLASGTLDASASAGVGAGTLSAVASSGTITDCASCIDIVGAGDVKGVSGYGYGAFLGQVHSGAAVENCYYGGTIASGSPARPFVGAGSNLVDVKNCFSTGGADAGSAPSVTALTADQLASWGAAYALNGGDGAKAFDSLTTWRQPETAADGTRENSGFPVLVASGATGDDAHLQPAANWGDVGAWVDAFAPAKKPAGAGTTASPYEVGTPEALAWWYQKVDRVSLASKNAISLTQDISLVGEAYGGTEADPVDWVSDEGAGYFNIDGGYHRITGLEGNSFLGGPLGANVRNLGIELGGFGVRSRYGNAGALAEWISKATIEDCYVVAAGAAKVTLTSGDKSSCVGGLIGETGEMPGTIMRNCYAAVPVESKDAGAKVNGLAVYTGNSPKNIVENCFYDADAAGSAVNASVEGISPLDSARAKSAALAFALNAERSGVDAPWSWAADANGGYPYFGADAAVIENWGQVGAFQSEADLRATDAGGGLEALSGSGTQADPLTIASPEALAWFAARVNAQDAKYVAAEVRLAADIDLAGLSYTGHSAVGDNLANCLPWIAISTASSSYSGTFDGNGHTIKNMRTTDGFFFASGGAILNLGLASSYVDASSSSEIYAGALVGYSTGAIDRCYADSGVTVVSSKSSHQRIGGLVGVLGNLGTAKNSWSRATVLGSGSSHYTGGMFGSIQSKTGTVENCWSRAAVSETGDSSFVGGFAGFVLAIGTLSGCYSAPVSLEGFLPTKTGVFAGCANNVSSAVSNCFHAQRDGLSGLGSNAGAELLPSAEKTADQLASWGAAYALNGGDGAKALDSLTAWRQPETAADGTRENNGFPVLVTSGATGDDAHLQPAANWGDVGAWVDAFAPASMRPTEASTTWRDGTSSNAYQIGTPEQLAWFAYKVNAANGEFGAKNAVLTQPVDLFGGAYTGKTFDAAASDLNAHLEADALVWVPIGNTVSGTSFVYAGTFDGRRLAVSHLFTPPTGARGGLFGNLSGTATGAAIEASYVCGEDVGSVVGMMHGASALVERCSASGNVKVSGSDMTGGMVGHAGFESSRVANCYSLAMVTGSGYSGGSGIVGYTFKGSIENCYFAGTAEEPVLGTNDSAGKGSNNYYLEGSFTRDSISKGQAKQVAANDLKSWGAAYQLNAPFETDGTQKALDALTVWRKAANDSENGGFPVLVTDGATSDAAHLQPAANWGEVGAWVNAFAPDKKPAEVDAPASWGKPEGAKAYAIASPEQLAWFVEKAPRGADGATPDALVTAPVDLAGNVYTGESGTGADFGACLEWASGYLLGSVFDGGGQSITNLYQKNKPGGLFSMIRDDATVRNVALQSGLVWITSDPAGPVGTFAMNLMNATVENCFSRVSIKNDSKYVPSVGFVGTAYYSRIDACYFAGALSGKADSCFYGYDNCTGTVYTDQDVSDAQGVEKLTTAQLKSWRGAYQLNGESYVGKPTADGGKVSSTVWTTDDAESPANGGYPVFGNLEPVKLSVTVDPNDVLEKPLGSDQPAKKVAGKLMAGLVEKQLTGLVTLLEAPVAPAGVALEDAAAVDAGFSTWGTANANAKLALVAGTTSLKADSAAGTVLSNAGLASLDLHAAAAYSVADARAVRFVVMDATGGYEVEATVQAVTEKTLDVSVPVESGASFELAPDGQVHENVMAKAASTLASNNFVPFSGSVSSVASLPKGKEIAYPDGSKAKVSAVLSPTGDKLAPTASAIDEGSKVRLFAGAAAGSGETAGLTPLAASLHFDPAKGTVPLAFAVPGGGQVMWKWGMDYTGTFLEPDGVFGFSTGYSFGLPSADVPAATLGEKA